MFKWKLKQKWQIKLMLFWYPQQSMCKIVCDFTSILLNCSMQGMTIVLLEKYFKYIQNGENAKC